MSLGQDLETVKSLSKELKILNLLKGIELSKERAKYIKKNIEKIEKMDETIKSEAGEYAVVFKAGLEKSIEILKAGKELPPSLRKDISTYNHKLKDLRKEREEKVFQVVNEVKNILEPHQIYQLHNFIPCLIPPPGKIRVGQADNPKFIEKQLEKIRNIPDAIYMQKKDDIIVRVIEKEKEHLSPSEELNEDAERKRIGNLLDKLRTMSDVDFAINKTTIAKEFIGNKKKSDSKDKILLRIRDFLLDPILLKYI